MELSPWASNFGREAAAAAAKQPATVAAVVCGRVAAVGAPDEPTPRRRVVQEAVLARRLVGLLVLEEDPELQLL